jgi:beta-carotene 15,15'-dioxygenase
MSNSTRHASSIVTASQLKASGLIILALLAAHALEAYWPPLSLWAFVLLSLTVGFGHGALDALLLLGQTPSRRMALLVSGLYLLCVLVAGWALSWSVPTALIILVLMSVWHFGEQHPGDLWARLCVGGASVMWPMLVAHDATSLLLLDSFGDRFGTALLAWQMLAKAWLIFLLGCGAVLAARWLSSRKDGVRNRAEISKSSELEFGLAISEILILLLAYLLLSPLLAFAIYFGLYHCLTHIARVGHAVNAHGELPITRYALAFVVTLLLSAALLALLWWFLPAAEVSGVAHAFANTGSLLQWLIVSLAAVTLPHLILVSYSARWLGAGHRSVPGSDPSFS